MRYTFSFANTVPGENNADRASNSSHTRSNARHSALGKLLLSASIVAALATGCGAAESDDGMHLNESAAETSVDATKDEGESPITLAAVAPANKSNVVVQARVGVDIGLDLVALTQVIQSVAETAANRGAFVRSVTDEVFYRNHGNANVMVFNRQQDLTFNPDPRTTAYLSVNYGGITYGIWIFEKAATFVNKGDGGYINWGFRGWFTRDAQNGGIVRFRDSPYRTAK